MVRLFPDFIKNLLKRRVVGLYRKIQEWDMSERCSRYRHEQNWLLDLEGKIIPERLEQLNSDRFAQVHGYPICWDKPKSFSEKIMWLSLYYQNPLRICTNKFKVKGYVEKILGPGYTLPVIDWWTDPDDIDFEKLPDKFVLKVNNNSGHNIFVPDKSQIDEQVVREKLRLWMHPANSGYYNIFSWAAKFSSPMIYAEDYLIPESGVDSLYNYKFSCYNGVCKNILVFSKKEIEAGYDPMWFDRDFNKLEFTIGKRKRADITLPKPECLSEMIRISEKLARPFPYLRVDLYEMDGRIFVGEMTFSFGNGLSQFEPVSSDFEIGGLLDIPEKMDFDRLVGNDLFSAQQAYLLDGRLSSEISRRCLERKAFTSLLYWPDLECPRSLNEKILWVMLYGGQSHIRELADRYEMKCYVARIVGEQYVIPTVGVYTDTNQIDWNSLPERFVAKSTANYGRDYRYFARYKVYDNEGIFKATVGDWLIPWNTFYYQNACLPGWKVPPRILIEELINCQEKRLDEYRFYCSRGKVKFVCAVCEQSTKRESHTYLDPDCWEVLPVRRYGKHKRSTVLKPGKLKEMLYLCRQLSLNFLLVRIDCFETEEHVYVNRMICGADLFQRLEPIEWDQKLGKQFEIE